MPAQRASNVKWNGNYIFGTDALIGKPDHSVLVAATIAAWAATEHQLGRAFSSLIGVKQPVTMSMYSVIRSFDVQRDILKAACFDLLPKRYAVMAYACIDTIHKAYETRNRFAHWLWGASIDPKVDALLLIHPKTLWQLHTTQQRFYLKNSLKNTGTLDFQLRLPRLCHDDIWVYKLDDLHAERAKLERAFGIAEALNQLVSSKSPRRQAIYRLLLSQPDLQSALKSTKKNWPKNRPAPFLRQGKGHRK